MKPADRAKFGEALAACYALYRAELTQPVAAMWWRALQAYDIAAVVEALGRHAMNPDTGQFLPKPADVVKVLDGATQDVALLAWAKVVKAMKDFGCYDSVAFDDPIIHRVLIDLGGWVWLGRQEVREMQFVEKRFRDAYRAWRARPALMDYPRSLPGLIETQNNAAGYIGANVKIRLAGDKDQARALLEGPKDAPQQIEMKEGATA